MGPLHTWVFGGRTSYQEEPCYALGCLTWGAPSGRGGSRLPLGTRPGQILKILSSVSRLTSRPRCRTRSNQTLLKLSYMMLVHPGRYIISLLCDYLTSLQFDFNAHISTCDPIKPLCIAVILPINRVFFFSLVPPLKVIG